MSRRVARGVVAVGLALAVAGCGGPPAPRSTWTVVSEALAAAPTGDTAPAAGASDRLVEAAVGLVAGGRGAPDGWQLVPLTDVAEGQALTERARPSTGAGVVAVRGRGAGAVALAVPVPGGPSSTERLGVDLFLRSHAVVLVVAGTPTAAASPGSAFRAVTAALGDRGLLLAVVEGYAPDTEAASPEVVLRGATDQPSDEELRIGTVLQSARVQVCVLVAEECIDPGVALEKTGAVSGGPVVRLQLAGRLQADAVRRDAVLTEIAKALDDL